MNRVDITLASGNKFTQHEPSKLEYYMSFSSKADFLIYEIGLYDVFSLSPYDEVTFSILPSVGQAVTFKGYLYSKENVGRANRVRLHFVSKYFKSLSSMEPLFGKGNLVDIAASLYSRTGVKQVIADTTNSAVDSIMFPRTTRLDDAIGYLLNRATTPEGSYLLGTIVGDFAFIRDIKKGKEDIKGTPTQNSDGTTGYVNGLYYIPMQVHDNRLKVDAEGGLSMTVVSDASNADKIVFSSAGSNKIINQMFYGISDNLLFKAAARIVQLKTYYSAYTAVLSVIGNIPLMGSNLIVDAADFASSNTWFRTLDTGKYFINSQALFIDFKQSYPKTQIGIQLIDDKVL